MCELFGLSCNKKDRATRSLPLFGGLSDITRATDGWGIGYYENGAAVIKKKPVNARTDREFLEYIEKPESNIIIAHLRWKSPGSDVCEGNCHPFKQNFNNQDWLFAHNGKVDNISMHPRSEGRIDSEQAFNFLIDYIKEYQNQGQIRGRYPGILYGIKKLFEQYGRNINFNFLMSDGDILYVFNHYKNRRNGGPKPIYFLRREKDYGGAMLVSTQKLTDENWLSIPEDRLLLILKGDFLNLSDPI